MKVIEKNLGYFEQMKSDFEYLYLSARYEDGEDYKEFSKKYQEAYEMLTVDTDQNVEKINIAMDELKSMKGEIYPRIMKERKERAKSRRMFGTYAKQ